MSKMSASQPVTQGSGDRIVSAETILISIPFREGAQPVWSFGGTPKNTFDTLLVRIETEAGIVGWGEAFSRGEDATLAALISSRVLPLVVGRDASQISKIKHEIEFQLQNFGRNGSLNYGVSAVDIALWDIAAKRAGVPLVKLLGGSFRSEVDVYASLLRYGTADGVVAACEDAIARGYRAIKLHEVEVDLIEIAAEACAGRARVMADVNCPWSPAVAIRHNQSLRTSSLHWLEEPVWPPEDYIGLARVRAASSTPIAAGENAGGLSEFVAMVQANAIDIAQPDIAKSGGVTELRRIVAFCEANAIRFEPHCALFGPGQIATVHLAASIQSAPMLERLFCDFEAELYDGATIPKNGVVSVPSSPGLGIDPNPDVIARYRVR